MMRLLRGAVLLTAALQAVACSESTPTAPTAVNGNAMSTPPVPAPVSQTLTGTWTGAGQRFTVTQIGSSATGMLAQSMTSLGNGITVIETATITGSVSGINVTLQMSNRFIVNEAGTAMNCTAAHSFTGALSGNILSGILTETAPFTCAGASPSIVVPQVSGAVTYTRQ